MNPLKRLGVWGVHVLGWLPEEGAKGTGTEKPVPAKNKVTANVVLIAVITLVEYVLGFSPIVFLVAAACIVGLALGLHYRTKPNLTANRVVYIGLFACWEGLALFFGLSIALVKTGLLPPTFEVEVSIIAASLVLGGATGDWVGRRRRYRPLNLP